MVVRQLTLDVEGVCDWKPGGSTMPDVLLFGSGGLFRSTTHRGYSTAVCDMVRLTGILRLYRWSGRSCEGIARDGCCAVEGWRSVGGAGRCTFWGWTTWLQRR